MLISENKHAFVYINGDVRVLMVNSRTYTTDVMYAGEPCVYSAHDSRPFEHQARYFTSQKITRNNDFNMFRADVKIILADIIIFIIYFTIYFHNSKQKVLNTKRRIDWLVVVTLRFCKIVIATR